MLQAFRTTAAIALPALVLAGGCRVLGSVDVSVVAWEAELVPTASAPTGSAAALSQSGRTQASIQISGGAAGERTYGWRIRAGRCASPGQVIGGAAAYPEMAHAPPATTTADAILSDPMPGGRAYHAVLIRLEDDAEVACGDLQRV